MRVLVDSSVWSLVLRRNAAPDHPAVRELGDLIRDLRAEIIGPIRQEILSGIRQQAVFERLRDHLRAFLDLEIVTADHERAAEFFNRCRARGVQASNTDFLICAVAERHGLSVFTLDEDFRHLTRHLPVTLHEIARET